MRNPILTVAWVRVEDGRILCARSRGRDAFYIPGGKLEPGETELDALLREIKEELAVDLVPETVRGFGTYQAQAHGQADGVVVVMSCYTADYEGRPAASGEIEELGWLGYADRELVAPVDQLLFDDLLAAGQLGLRLGGRQRDDVELIAFGIGHHPPPEAVQIAGFAGFEPPAAEGLDLGGGGVEVVHYQVEVQPVLA